MSVEGALPYRAIAEEAGLTEDEVILFEGGCRGTSLRAITLDRKRYTALQTAFERALASFFRVRDDLRKDIFVIIHTEKPSTPTWKDDHSRFDIIRELALRDRVVLICRFDGLDSLSSQDERFDENARRHLKAFIGMLCKRPHRMSVSEEGNASHMVFDGSSLQLPCIGFLAEQLPSTDDGKVVFGKLAADTYTSNMSIHEQNVKAGRATSTVEQYLNL